MKLRHKIGGGLLVLFAVTAVSLAFVLCYNRRREPASLPSTLRFGNPVRSP